MMKKIINFVFLFGLFCTLNYAQQPQTPNAPITSLNAKYTNGVAPGYWPTIGTGLTVNVSAGTANCLGTIVTYPGGNLTMTANTINYVYLDSANLCIPAVKTLIFTATDIPIGIVTTSSSISNIADVRTPFTIFAEGCAEGTCLQNHPIGSQAIMQAAGTVLAFTTPTFAVSTPDGLAEFVTGAGFGTPTWVNTQPAPNDGITIESADTAHTSLLSLVGDLLHITSNNPIRVGTTTGTAQQITNLSPGTNPTDAVNLSQLSSSIAKPAGTLINQVQIRNTDGSAFAFSTATLDANGNLAQPMSSTSKLGVTTTYSDNAQIVVTQTPTYLSSGLNQALSVLAGTTGGLTQYIDPSAAGSFSNCNYVNNIFACRYLPNTHTIDHSAGHLYDEMVDTHSVPGGNQNWAHAYVFDARGPQSCDGVFPISGGTCTGGTSIGVANGANFQVDTNVFSPGSYTTGSQFQVNGMGSIYTNASLGIAQGDSRTCNLMGTGDGVCAYWYTNISRQGAKLGDDEGAGIFSNKVIEPTNLYTATVVTTGTKTVAMPDNSTYSFSYLQTGGNSQNGADSFTSAGHPVYILKNTDGSSAANFTANITNLGGINYLGQQGLATFTVDTTLPVSTYIGSVNGAIATPVTQGHASTVTNISVGATGGTTGVLTSGYACFADGYGDHQERAAITVTSGVGGLPPTGTLQIITANLLFPYSGAFVFQGGLCDGTNGGAVTAVLTGVNTSAGVNPMVMSFPIIGTADAHTPIYSIGPYAEGNIFSSYPEILPQVESVTLFRTSNTTYVKGGNGSWCERIGIVISGAADVTMDGTFTLTCATAFVDGSGNTYNMSYANTGTTSTTAVNATATSDRGRESISFYGGTSLVTNPSDVSNEFISLGTFIGLSNSDAVYAAGQTIQQGQYFTWYHNTFNSQQVTLPDAAGDNYELKGPMASLDTGRQGAGYTHHLFVNGNDISLYDIGGGSYGRPPRYSAINGPISVLYDFTDFADGENSTGLYPTMTLFKMSCPSHGSVIGAPCNYANDFITLEDFGFISGADYSTVWNWANQTYAFNLNGTGTVSIDGGIVARQGEFIGTLTSDFKLNVGGEGLHFLTGTANAIDAGADVDVNGDLVVNNGGLFQTQAGSNIQFNSLLNANAGISSTGNSTFAVGADALHITTTSTSSIAAFDILAPSLSTGNNLCLGIGTVAATGTEGAICWVNSSAGPFMSMETVNQTTPVRIGGIYTVSSGPMLIDTADIGENLATIPAGIALAVNGGNHTTVFSVDVAGEVTASNITVGNSTAGQYIISGPTPTMAAGTAAGTGSNCITISGTNFSGNISCTTGTGTLNESTMASISFTGPIAAIPNKCTLTEQNDIASTNKLTIYTTIPTSSGWSIMTGLTAPSTSQTFLWGFSCN